MSEKKARRSPSDKPELLVVPPLDIPHIPEKKNGRPKKLDMPPIPQAILDGMTPLEREWFWYFIHATEDEFPDLRPFEKIQTHTAAMDFINTMRLEVEQLTSNTLVTMSRQHPAVQCRSWIDSIRKGRAGTKSAGNPEDETTKKFLLGLSG